MGKSTENEKTQKTVDGKIDGKRKKTENCRWENRRKRKKTLKIVDGTFDGKQQTQNSLDWKKAFFSTT